MNRPLKIEIRTADQTRKAQVEAESDQSAAELIQAAVDNWKLPLDTDYTLVNVTRGTTVPASQTVGSVASPGDVLEVQPVLVAGLR
ncbi:MAG TPA: hypothetical protein VEA81_13975 [Burkholderiaceae bacterium]|nr:hypothetical protein [Burkholderiaceae bacterium]